jgi:hypothetical protein
MTTDVNDPTAEVKAEAEQIVAGGTEIRERLGEAVAQAAEKSQQSGQGLVSLVRAVLDGAREGLDRSVPADPDDVLRQVVDALGDGFCRSALAARLALEEARGTGRQFAREDLVRLRDDLQEIKRLFQESVSRALKGGRQMTASQFSGTCEHAGRVKERLGGVVGTVLDAVRRDPILLGKESLIAGVSTGRHAAGALFLALGGMLERAGDRLRKDGNKT